MFGNARFARNLLEAAIGKHAWRLRDIDEPTVEQLRKLIADDFDEGETEDNPPVMSHEPAAEDESAKLEEPTSEPG
jgi:hypothetical protein